MVRAARPMTPEITPTTTLLGSPECPPEGKLVVVGCKVVTGVGIGDVRIEKELEGVGVAFTVEVAFISSCAGSDVGFGSGVASEEKADCVCVGCKVVTGVGIGDV